MGHRLSEAERDKNALKILDTISLSRSNAGLNGVRDRVVWVLEPDEDLETELSDLVVTLKAPRRSTSNPDVSHHGIQSR